MSELGYDGPTFTEEELRSVEGRGSDGFLEYLCRGPVKKRNPGWMNITIANEMRSEAKRKRLELEDLEREMNIERMRQRSPQGHAC